MYRIVLTSVAIGLGILATDIQAGPADRLEDRIDRRESVIDRQTDNGRLDRIEDRIDAVESAADRRGIERWRRIDRHERRPELRKASERRGVRSGGNGASA